MNFFAVRSCLFFCWLDNRIKCTLVLLSVSGQLKHADNPAEEGPFVVGGGAGDPGEVGHDGGRARAAVASGVATIALVGGPDGGGRKEEEGGQEEKSHPNPWKREICMQRKGVISVINVYIPGDQDEGNRGEQVQQLTRCHVQVLLRS